MKVRFMTFEIFHGRGQTGSTTIRATNLINNWPEADYYKYGEKPDVLIFQKVYCTPDYKFPVNYNGGLKILDICDPDWLDNAYVAETVAGMDAVVVPTKAMQEFMQQLTDKPVKIIKDRFDLTKPPSPKLHKGKIKRAFWFGYSHNADLLQMAVRSLEQRGIGLSVLSDSDPQLWHYAEDTDSYRKLYKYQKYKEDRFYAEAQKCDIAVLPKGFRPQDRFKSENKTVKSWLAGLPVVANSDELDALQDDKARNKVVQSNYKKAISEYDVKLSVKEYQELIDAIRNNKS